MEAARRLSTELRFFKGVLGEYEPYRKPLGMPRAPWNRLREGRTREPRGWVRLGAAPALLAPGAPRQRRWTWMRRKPAAAGLGAVRETILGVDADSILLSHRSFQKPIAVSPGFWVVF